MYVDHTRWNPDWVPPLAEWATPADALLWDLLYSIADDRLFRHQYLVKYPDRIALAMARRFKTTHDTQGLRAANIELRETTDSLSTISVRLSASDTELSDAAKAYGRACGRIAARHADPDVAYLFLCEYANQRGVAPPPLEHYTVIGAVRRMGCARWWRKALKKAHGRTLERHSIGLGMVHRQAAPYVGDENFQRIQARGLRNRELLEALEATNEREQTYSLADLSDRSVSNPKNRRNELMARMRGSESHAQRAGHAGVFLTLTAPSCFHPRLAQSGGENPKWDGSSPKDAQDYLCKLWSRARAALNRREIFPYGFRIAEPHHDGTPHWHLLLFVPESQLDTLVEVCRHYALEKDPDEPGARENRFKAVLIDHRKGSATGYVAKYVSKNIDGYGIDADELGNAAPDSARRVQAWASLWGIRQFQAIGGPPVGVYRELRRIHSEVTESPAIEAARQAAYGGDWCGYIQAMGGVHCRREDRPVWLHKVWSDKEGPYGEPIGEIVQGVEAIECRRRTRQEWTIALKRPAADAIGAAQPYRGELVRVQPSAIDPIGEGNPIVIDQPSDSGAGSAFVWERERGIDLEAWPFPPVCPLSPHTHWSVFLPWSSVNNCTQPPRTDAIGVPGNDARPAGRDDTCRHRYS